MKQSLTSRLAALALSIVITSFLLESVADLGRPGSNGEVQVADAAQVLASSPLR